MVKVKQVKQVKLCKQVKRVKRGSWLKTPPLDPNDPGPPSPDDPGYPFWEVGQETVYRPWLLKGEDDPGDAVTGVWIKAIEDVDRRDDDHYAKDDLEKEKAKAAKARLVALLESKYPMTDDARRHFADLLNRRVLKKKPGAQRTPSYERLQSM